MSCSVSKCLCLGSGPFHFIGESSIDHLPFRSQVRSRSRGLDVRVGVGTTSGVGGGLSGVPPGPWKGLIALPLLRREGFVSTHEYEVWFPGHSSWHPRWVGRPGASVSNLIRGSRGVGFKNYVQIIKSRTPEGTEPRRQEVTPEPPGTLEHYPGQRWRHLGSSVYCLDSKARCVRGLLSRNVLPSRRTTRTVPHLFPSPASRPRRRTETHPCH